MFSYIRQYTLYPPTEIRQKRTRQKLKHLHAKSKQTNNLRLNYNRQQPSYQVHTKV